jgi:hypothetical protein
MVFVYSADDQSMYLNSFCIAQGIIGDTYMKPRQPLRNRSTFPVNFSDPIKGPLHPPEAYEVSGYFTSPDAVITGDAVITADADTTRSAQVASAGVVTADPDPMQSVLDMSDAVITRNVQRASAGNALADADVSSAVTAETASRNAFHDMVQALISGASRVGFSGVDATPTGQDRVEDSGEADPRGGVESAIPLSQGLGRPSDNVALVS